MRVRRLDLSGEEASELSPPVQLENGSLRVEGYATRVGVLRYLNLDGSERLEFRPPEEVSKADSLRTLNLRPLTNEHPPVGVVTPDNVDTYGRGLVLEGTSFDEASGRVKVAVLATHKELIDVLQVKAKRELSCGYDADVTEEAGMWQGQRYTHVQRNIVYNHLAVVDRGRAGPACALRLDSDGNVSSPIDTPSTSPSNVANPTPIPGPGVTRPEVRKDMELVEVYINGVCFKLPPEAAAAIVKERANFETQRATLEAKITAMAADAASKAGQMQTQVQQAQQQAEDAKSGMEAVQEKNTQLQAKVDSLDAKLKEVERQRADAVDPARLMERVHARVSLQTQAARILGAHYEFTKPTRVDGGAERIVPKSDHEVRLDVLSHMAKSSPAIQPKLDANKGNESYISVMFDTLASTATHTDGAGVPPRVNIGNDGPPTPNATAISELEKAKALSRDAWRRPSK